MFNHALSSLLSAAASIGFFGVGSAYKLYQCLFNVPKPQQYHPIHTDSLHHILAQLPLGERLQTTRQVNSQWAEVVAGQFCSQTMLTLQIGASTEHWARLRADSLKYTEIFFPPKTLQPFHAMTVDQLTKEVITTLASTFPRLQTLTVLVERRKEDIIEEEEEKEDYSSLSNLPLLISSYAGTLTTLQIVFNIGNAPFQTYFPAVVTSIGDLHQLKRLSLVDLYLKLIIPATAASLDLARLPRSLERLQLQFSGCKVPKLFRRWQRHLSSDQGAANGVQLKIDLVMATNLRDSPVFAELAAHFNTFFLVASTADEVRTLGDRFTALRTLVLRTTGLPSLADTVAQLAKLPHLKHLALVEIDGENDGGDADVPLPPLRPPPPPPSPLPSVQYLRLGVMKAVFRHADLAELLHPAVLPNVREVEVLFGGLVIAPTTTTTTSCADCGWTLKSDPRNGSQTAGDQLRQCQAALRRCLGKVAAPFAATAAATTTKPNFLAQIAVSKSSLLACRIKSEDWPAMSSSKQSVGSVGSNDDAGNGGGLEFTVPQRYFKLAVVEKPFG